MFKTGVIHRSLAVGIDETPQICILCKFENVPNGRYCLTCDYCLAKQGLRKCKCYKQI